MILRNSDGPIIFLAYRFLFQCKDALEAATSATLEGLSIIMQRSYLLDVIQFDSSVPIASLMDVSLGRSAYGHLMKEIKKLLDLRLFR